MTEKDLWPWPGDNLTDRARRVALNYREALRDRDPALCDQLDARVIYLGQHWVIPKAQTRQLHDLLNRWEAADYCGVKAKTISEWRRRGLKITPTPDGDRYKVEDLIEYQAEIRQRRVNRAS